MAIVKFVPLMAQIAETNLHVHGNDQKTANVNSDLVKKYNIVC